MSEQTVEWTNCVPDVWVEGHPDPNHTFVSVSDGVESYCRALLPDETLAEACAEYAATADYGDRDGSGAVDCVAYLYREGGEDWAEYRRFTVPCR